MQVGPEPEPPSSSAPSLSATRPRSLRGTLVGVGVGVRGQQGRSARESAADRTGPEKTETPSPAREWAGAGCPGSRVGSEWMDHGPRRVLSRSGACTLHHPPFGK